MCRCPPQQQQQQQLRPSQDLFFYVHICLCMRACAPLSRARVCGARVPGVLQQRQYTAKAPCQLRGRGEDRYAHTGHLVWLSALCVNASGAAMRERLPPTRLTLQVDGAERERERHSKRSANASANGPGECVCVRVRVCLSSSVREGLAYIGIRLSLFFCRLRVDAPLKTAFRKGSTPHTHAGDGGEEGRTNGA